MTKNLNVFELNGKQYDALTGAYIGPVGHTSATPAQQAAAAPAAAPAVTPAVRTAPQHIKAHKPQHAMTLMRHAVRAPHAAPKTAIRTQAPVAAVQTAAPAGPAIQQKPSVVSVNPHRTQRALTVDRSRMVRRFQNPAVPVSQAAAPAIPQSVPASQPAQPAFATTPVVTSSVTAASAKPAAPVTHPSHVTVLKPAHAVPAKQATPAVTQAPAKPSYAASVAAQRVRQQAAAKPAPQQRRPSSQSRLSAMPSALRRQKPAAQPEQDIFEQALALATSHEQRPPKESMIKAARRRKRVRRVLSLAASAAVFLLLIGFVAYQNKASIELQMASAKAGFPASTPGYKPDGFAVDKINYSPGTVAAWYKKDDKTFSVIQKKSNWDSQTLLENFVSTTNEEYQGYQANGRTIYVYGVGRATWVNGGIWYQIHAGDALPNDQLVKVAASL